MQDITHQNLEADLVNASLAQPVLLDIWAPVVRPVQDARPDAREARDRLRRPLQARQAQRRRRARDRPAAVADVRRPQHPVLRPLQGRPAGRRLRRRLARGRGAQVPRQARAERRRAGRRRRLAEAAEELLAEGDTETALDRLQAALATNPANDTARYDYLRALLTAGRVAEARDAFEPVAAGPVPDAAPGRRGPLDRRARSGAEGAPAGHAGRRDRRQQARLRRPLRAGPAPLRQGRASPGDGRAARDHHARQGLEGRAGAQELCRDPADHDQGPRAKADPAAPKQGALEIAGKPAAAAPADPVSTRTGAS